MKDKPVDRDVDRMRGLLARTPPADPGAEGRADAVMMRARRDRRRRGVIGGVAVALFAAAVIVTPHFLKTSPTTNEATDPDNGVEVAEASDAQTADPCPNDPIDISDAEAIASLPDGADSIRLCRALSPHVRGGQSKQDVVSAWVPPADALVVDPDAFVGAVAQAPTWDPAECATIDGSSLPFALVVSYPDQQAVIGSRMSMCSAVRIAGREVGTNDILDAFTASLQSQRGGLEPPPASRPSCGAVEEQKPSTYAIDELGGPTTAGVVCYTVDPQGGPEYADDEGALSDDQVAVLESDIKANREAVRGMCTDTGPTRVIRLVDEWGDVTSWVDDRCTGDFVSPTGIWSPSDEAEQVIADALGGRA